MSCPASRTFRHIGSPMIPGPIHPTLVIGPPSRSSKDFHTCPAANIREDDIMAGAMPAILRMTPLFFNLPPEDLSRIAGISSLRHCAKRDTVFREGDRADGFYVVVSGGVKVFKLSEDGKEQVLHILKAGQSFAEATIFEGGVFPANAEALCDGDLLFLPKRPFIELLEKNPRLGLRALE